MNTLRKYKNLIAVFLLTVYAFVTTPVQLWHNHTETSINFSSKFKDDKQKITDGSSFTNSSEENCSICSHHYSIFCNDVTPPIIIFLPYSEAKQACNNFNLFTTPIFHFTNKGPPAFCSIDTSC